MRTKLPSLLLIGCLFSLPLLSADDSSEQAKMVAVLVKDSDPYDKGTLLGPPPPPPVIPPDASAL